MLATFHRHGRGNWFLPSRGKRASGGKKKKQDKKKKKERREEENKEAIVSPRPTTVTKHFFVLPRDGGGSGHHHPPRWWKPCKSGQCLYLVVERKIKSDRNEREREREREKERKGSVGRSVRRVGWTMAVAASISAGDSLTVSGPGVCPKSRAEERRTQRARRNKQITVVVGASGRLDNTILHSQVAVGRCIQFTWATTGRPSTRSRKSQFPTLPCRRRSRHHRQPDS